MAVHAQMPERTSRERSKAPSIPNYELIRLIGEGSYGEVWLAKNVLGQYRAVKLVYRARFDSVEPYNRELNGIKEYEPISRSHDGLIDILHVGSDEENGFFYYVMELADDEKTAGDISPERYQPCTLQSYISEKRLPLRECIRIGMTLANALAALHRKRLMHRDIKPCSLLFVNGEPKLADIGLVTREGQAKSYVGTEGYIPPEGPNSYQADIFALGKVLYQMGTGHRVEQYPEWLSTSLGADEHALFLELNDIICKACAVDREERYRNAEQLVAELSLIQAGHSVRSVRRLERMKRLGKRATRPAVILLVLLLVIAGVRERIHRAQVRQQRAHANMAEGDRKLQQGDYFTAVSHYADALAISPGDEEICRLKIGSTLAASPQLVQIAQATAHIYFAAFSPRGDLVITAEADGGLQLRAAEDLHTIGQRFYHGAGKGARTARFDPAQRLLVTSGSDNFARLWDVETQREAGAFEHEEEVVSASFSPDGAHLLTAAGTLVFLWDVAGHQCVGTFVGHGAKVLHVTFSPDGQQVLTASQDGSACLWNASDQKPVRPFWHKSWVYHASFSPDSKYVATASYDRSVCVWNASTGQPVRIIPHGAAAVAVEFSADGRHIATACWDSTARIWHWKSGKPLTPPMRHASEVWHATFSPEGRRLLTVGWDKTLRLWDLAASDTDWRPLNEYYSEAGTYYYEKIPGGIAFRRTSDRALLGEWGIPHLQAVFQNYAGDSVITRAKAGPVETIQFWRLGLPQTVHLTGTDAESRWIINRDGTYAACVAAERIELWDTKRSSRVAQLNHVGNVRIAEFSADNRLLCSADKTNAYLWRLDRLSSRPLVLAHDANISHLCFSPDSTRLVTCCSSRSLQEQYVQLWFTKTGRPASGRLWHDDGVTRAVFSPDSKLLLTCGEDRLARIWDVRDGKLRVAPLAHAANVTFGSFSPDAKYVMTATDDGVVQTWDVRSGTTLGPERRFSGRLWEARFVADWRMLVAAPSEQVIWNIVPQSGPIAELRFLAQLLSGTGAAPPRSSIGMGPREQHTLLKDWHLREAARSERDNAPFAARYHLTEAIAAGNSSLDVLVRRASANAALECYNEAEADYQACLTAGMTLSQVLCDYARILARAQKLTACREICMQLVRELPNISDAKVRDDAIWVSLLCSEPDLVRSFETFTEQAQTTGGSKIAAGYAFRMGRLTEMTNLISRSAALLGKQYRAEDRVLLALACAKLGQAHISKQIVAEAETWMRYASEEKPIPDTGYSLTWQRRLDLQRLIEETKSVLNAEFQAANSP